MPATITTKPITMYRTVRPTGACASSRFARGLGRRCAPGSPGGRARRCGRRRGRRRGRRWISAHRLAKNSAAPIAATSSRRTSSYEAAEHGMHDRHRTARPGSGPSDRVAQKPGFQIIRTTITTSSTLSVAPAAPTFLPSSRHLPRPAAAGHRWAGRPRSSRASGRPCFFTDGMQHAVRDADADDVEHDREPDPRLGELEDVLVANLASPRTAKPNTNTRVDEVLADLRDARGSPRTSARPSGPARLRRAFICWP